MNLRPSETLTETQVKKGLDMVIVDGLASEAMVTFTGGTFLVAIAIYLGATNFQLGILAALPTFSSIFQLASIWLVRRFNNRRGISVFSNLFARFPLFVVGILPLAFSAGTSIQVVIFTLFFHYFFGSVAGASWNSWMKDLVPEEKLGSYFSHRSRLCQMLNVTLSLSIALFLDWIKAHHPEMEITAYSIMFLIGGAVGMIGIFALSNTPEPKSYLTNENLFKLFKLPLKDRNFRSLLTFQAFWAFALNLATPFFSVFMMKTIGLPLSYIIGLGILNQISSISALKFWGQHADKFSNKTIISISAPIYIACIFAWTFAAMPAEKIGSLAILVIINIFTGMATAGVNLAISNIGMKLASKQEAIVYLTAKNMVVALFSTIAPIIGGLMADFFSSHQFIWNLQWKSAHGISTIPLIDLNGWNFFFVIGGILALFSLQLLKKVHEKGEVRKERATLYIRAGIKNKFREGLFREPVLARIIHPVAHPFMKKKALSLRK